MMTRISALFVITAVSLVPANAGAQPGAAQAPAATLAALLQQAKMDSFAVKVDGEADLYVSAMYVPGSQLLVVSGRYQNPAALDARIAARDYRGAYSDHNASTLRDGKLFVMDMQANGLADRAGDGQPFDIVYENGVTTTMFNGNWRAQELSERDYRERFATVDQRYAEMLGRLIEGMKRLAPPQALAR